MKVRQSPFKIDITNGPIDRNDAIQIDYQKCIGCQMCAKTCTDSQNFNIFKISAPKTKPFVNAYGSVAEGTERNALAGTDCTGCGACVRACPVEALMPAFNIRPVLEQISEKKKVTIAVIAPSTRVGLAEGMGMGVGVTAERQMVYELKQMGFDYVFDNMWGADATTTEDAKEILKAKAAGKTAFTSCCPAWVKLVETTYPELLPNISSARSPHGIICSVIKKYFAKDIGKKADELYVVGVMPCTAKKNEAARKELTTDGSPDCDISITTRELMAYLKEKKVTFSAAREIELKDNVQAQYDAPFNTFSGSAYIYGKTAGVTEAVVRYVCAIKKVPFSVGMITKELIWENKLHSSSLTLLTFSAAGEDYRICVSYGGLAAHKAVELYKSGELKVDAVEVMVCPGGCVGGGGQPKQPKKDMILKRHEGLDKHDKEAPYSNCTENPTLNEFYERIGTDVHHVMHTTYSAYK
ncbi:FeFe-hydrogenase 5 [Spironucleus salmonicida]|uniref:FeFe-hydrogenase 5 n=1 Tax=Spironucleus salmonicida TaxID=348837 RepID=K7REK6_9EUKA|nr:FeFe-hydrogenase 5 [Spironucleus salmonicida]KAH0572912.1 FeFe-hydrogenase 5 [Spironucleus salmonicida]|eukprot:EST43080.1 [FeFe]-hydrogenase 5 [Spironucleus salmonicida]